ncbi:MAG: MFS transporter [Deltaproteobacteria bacterium]|nr:MFS transporter [Deltaproteobacteria bacterium]
MKKIYISQIIDQLGVSKFTFKIFILVGLSLFFDGFDYMIVAYTMPQIAKEWGLSKIQTGSLASWSLLGLMIGGLIAGVVSDRIGRKKVLALSCMAYSCLTLPIYFAPNYVVFSLLRVLSGIGLGACIPVALTVISEFSPSRNRGFFSATVMCFVILGYVSAGLAAIYIVPALGWRLCYLIGGLPVIYGIFLIFKLTESPHWLLCKGREQEAINIVQGIERAVTGNARELPLGTLQAPPPPKSVGVKAIFSPEYRRATLSIWAVYFLACIILYGVTSWLPSLLVEKGYGVVRSYSFAVLQHLFGLLGAVMTGYMVDRIGRKNNVIVGNILCAVTIILLGFTTNQWQVVICSVLVGIAMNYGMAGLMPLLAEAYRTEFRNTGVSWAQAFGRVGGFCGPIMAGGIQQMGLGFTGVFVFLATPAVLGVIIAVFFIGETKGRTAESIAVAEA